MINIKASIIGGSGYAGGELARLLLNHPTIELNQMTSRTLDGKYITNVHPNLRGKSDLKFCSIDDLENTDILFLCMPHGMAMEKIDTYMDIGDRIIDLSSDFRLHSPKLYRQFYDQTHPMPDIANKFVYGVVELHRDDMANANYISSAGCNATASILGLLPVIDTLEPNHIIIDVKVGSSEGGRSHSAGSHHPERSGSVRSYKPTGHRHSAEIIEQLGLSVNKLSFSATSIEMIRGVLATIHILSDANVEDKDLWKAFRSTYNNEPFVRIVKERTGIYRYPDPKLLIGSNYCDVGFEVDPMTNRIVVLAALDNLMKGAAGQAIQAMNVMLKIDENEGLSFNGIHP